MISMLLSASLLSILARAEALPSHTSPTRSQATSPSLAEPPPNGCLASRANPITVTCKSRGSPDDSPSFPPIRILSVAPSPASKAIVTATGSHRGATATPPIPRASKRAMTKVESPAAPRPVLSAISASTNGFSSDVLFSGLFDGLFESAATTVSSASSSEQKGATICCRCSHTQRPS